MVSDILECLNSGSSVHFSMQVDPILEETVDFAREVPGRFSVITQTVFLDGSATATPPRFATLDEEAARMRISELLTAGFSWVASR